MIYQDKLVNSTITITTKVAGATQPVDLILLKDGGVTSTTLTFVSLNAAGLCNLSFTPTTTGTYTIFGNGTILAVVEVVTKPIKVYLQTLEDEALGSWSWNKTTGALALLKQDGSSLANFTVVDDLTTSSRERI